MMMNIIILSILTLGSVDARLMPNHVRLPRVILGSVILPSTSQFILCHHTSAILPKHPRMSLSRIRLVKRPIGVVAKAAVFQPRFYSVGENKPIPDSPPLTSRWFTDLQGQLKELTDAKQPSECARQARELYEFSQNNWLELLAGQQGFLTDKKWRGLNNHQLLWGDMVSGRWVFG